MGYNYKDLQDQMEAILSSGISENELLQLVDKAPQIFRYTTDGVKGILESLSSRKHEPFQKQAPIFNLEQLALQNGITTTPLDDIIDKILRSPSDFYKRISEELTPEERIFIIQNLENKSCINCTNESCRVPYKEKTGLDESGKPQGSSCISWNNDVLIGKCKVLRINDTNILK